MYSCRLLRSDDGVCAATPLPLLRRPLPPQPHTPAPPPPPPPRPPPPQVTLDYDMTAPLANPRWTDGYVHFSGVLHEPGLCVIVDVR